MSKRKSPPETVSVHGCDFRVPIIDASDFPDLNFDETIADLSSLNLLDMASIDWGIPPPDDADLTAFDDGR